MDDSNSNLKGEDFFDASPSETELAYRWVLWQISGAGYQTFNNVLNIFDGELSILQNHSADTIRTRLIEHSIGEELSEKIIQKLVATDPVSSYRRELESLPPDARIVHIGEEYYPSRLWDMKKPPIFLYMRGNPSALFYPKFISIVGSRSAGTKGVHFAKELAKDLAKRGISIVSGGAIGIDGAAHRGAIDEDVATLVILPGGIDRPQPACNRKTFDRALEKGIWLSEYPTGTDVRRFHFHRRNRLIAALGDGVVIVRAGLNSGTMITAEAARDISRPVLAVPGRVDDPLAQGSLELLVSGAHCVRDSDDVISALFGSTLGEETAKVETDDGCSTAKQNNSVNLDKLNSISCELYEWLQAKQGRIIHLDDIVRGIDLPISDINTALLELQLNGIVERIQGSTYKLTG